MAIQFCYECGKQVSTEAPSCPHCGAPARGTASVATTAGKRTSKSPKSKSTAAAMAIFLGGIGMHWFYLEEPKRGILYALFFWTMIPAIFAFFTGIGFALMSDKKFHEQYG